MKKVLIISYYWPPSAGIAVLRVLKITKYLSEFGWEPIVYIPKNADYPGYDQSNFKDIPSNITIIRGNIWEPYKIYRKLTNKKSDAIVNNVFYSNDKKTGILHDLSVWIRSNFFIPDARFFWIRPSVEILIEYLKENKVDAIFSDGPPHTNTRIANIIKKKTGIPWLADFQDPWTQVDYYQMLKLTKWADKKHHRQEQEVFENADAITIVSKVWKTELERIGAKNVHVAYWGFDLDDYQDIQAKQHKTKFNIVHIGILGHDRNPEQLFLVLKELLFEHSHLNNIISLNLVGQVDISIINTIEKYGLKHILNLTGNVSRKEALDYVFKSDLLLLPINRQYNSAGRVPGKLFEYLASKRPIMCFTDHDGDSGQIVSNTTNGSVFSYEENQELKKELLNLIGLKESNKSNLNVNNIDQYSIKNSVKIISDLLNEIIHVK